MLKSVLNMDINVFNAHLRSDKAVCLLFPKRPLKKEKVIKKAIKTSLSFLLYFVFVFIQTNESSNKYLHVIWLSRVAECVLSLKGGVVCPIFSALIGVCQTWVLYLCFVIRKKHFVFLVSNFTQVYKWV